jgi:hypothetical protein
MTRRAVFDHDRLARILDAQHQVISRSQALACGLPRSTVTSWSTPTGKWQRMLPGVYLTVTGKPTPEQRLMAALLYAGPRSVITGVAALRSYRLRAPGSDVIDVIVPQGTRRQGAGFVRIHRTRQLPRVYKTGVIRYAAPARAVADAARLLTSLDDVRAVVAEAIQRQTCSLAQLGQELERAGSRDSSPLRTALADVQAGSLPGRLAGPKLSGAACLSTASSRTTSPRSGSTTTGTPSTPSSGHHSKKAASVRVSRSLPSSRSPRENGGSRGAGDGEAGGLRGGQELPVVADEGGQVPLEGQGRGEVDRRRR